MVPYGKMAQLYQLVPLPLGIFSGLSLVERAALGLLYDRMKLSVHHHLSDPEGGAWLDEDENQVYCIYSQTEMAKILGVSERTVRRALEHLEAERLIWWKKAKFQGANKYFLNQSIREVLRCTQSGQNVQSIRSDCPL